MPRLIKDRQVVDDEWVLLRDAVDEDVLKQHTGRDLIVPLSAWLEQQTLLAQHDGRVAPWLDSHELPEQLGDSLHELPLIALNFPVFKDGRAYSSARELREQFGYQGEIRAIGDVLRDQLFYMARCGFNAFDMREDQDLDASLKAFQDFREAYQASVDQPIPLFRRRRQLEG